jgi:ribose-phosphate pyrophosphokinase
MQSITINGSKRESVGKLATKALRNAYERIENSKLTELIITDSISKEHPCSKIKVLSCAELFADVMHRVHSNTSISSKFVL